MRLAKFKSLLFATIGLFVISGNAQAMEERVVATVDGVPILASQVSKGLGKQANTAGNRQKVLDSIIDDMLVQKAVQESGVKIDNRKVEQIIEGIAAQNGLTYGQLLDALDYQGITLNQFRNQIANQMLMSEVRNRSIGKHIDVTREQVESLSEQLRQSSQGSKVIGKEYQVRHILLKLNPLLNDAQAKAQLERIRADIVSGKTTFADAAKAHSKDYLSGANGGDLGFAFPESYAEAFAQNILNAKPGVISAPFKTEFGWHILEVTGSRDGDKTEYAYRQKAYETLVNQQLREEQIDWVKGLRRGAQIKYFNP